MGGVRDGMALTRQWYERLPRLIPDLKFTVHRILVSGWPWKTEIMVEWSDHFSVEGQPTGNHGVHRMTMQWGKVTELAIYCDTQRLAEVLQQKAASGLAEAAMPEIGVPAP
jgi:ketosteroid isomerase-like protein